MAFCYEELECWEDACKVWEEISDHLTERGFDVEANWPRAQAGKCRAKMNG